MATNLVTEAAAEVLHSGAANARVTEAAAEVLHAGAAKARVTVAAVEVLRTVAVAVPTGMNVTEAPDVFAATGGVGYVGTLAATEAKDTFAGAGGVPITGTLASTEASDKVFAYIFTPPIGTWASTEAPDTMGNARQERFEVEKVDAGTGFFPFSTNGPDRILCLFVGTVASGAAADHVTAISDSTGLVWHAQDYIDIGRDEDGQQLHTEMWWAYAKDQITNSICTVTLGGGFSFTHNLVALAHIKGAGGNFNNPFSDTNPYSYGGNYGAFVTPPLTQITASRPIATGPLSSSGAVINPITFDPANNQHVTLDVTDLKVTSTGSGNHTSYATINVADARSSGKVYFEAKFKNIAGSKYGFGVAWASDSGGSIASCIADGHNGTMIYGDGTIWIDGVQVATVGCVPANNDIIGICIDFDNNALWARDVTQNSAYNSNVSALPTYSTGHFNAGGLGYVAGDSPPGPGAAHAGTGSILMPFSSVDGTSSSAEMDVNFGQNTFVGTAPPGYELGWGHAAPAVTPTRVEQHAIVLGWDISVPDDSIAEAPPGFTLHYAHLGDVSAGFRMSIYSKVIAQNILTTDNERMTHATPTKHWAMLYDTLVAGHVSPGTLESTEAPDFTFIRGYPGANGERGFLTTTEAADTFAALGYATSSGTWISTEAPDKFSAFIKVPITGTFVVSEAVDRFSGAGIGRGEDGVLISTESLDIFAASGTVPISGSLLSTEAPDRFSALGAGVIRVRRYRNFFVT